MQASGRLLGRVWPAPSWLFPRGDLCHPRFAYEYGETSSLFFFHLLFSLASISPYFSPYFPLTLKKELGYSSCFLLLQWWEFPSTVFTSWVPGIAIAFPLPFLSALKLEWWEPYEEQSCPCIASVPGPFLLKTYTAADKSLQIFLTPFSKSVMSENHPEWKKGQAVWWLLLLIAASAGASLVFWLSDVFVG